MVGRWSSRSSLLSRREEGRGGAMERGSAGEGVIKGGRERLGGIGFTLNPHQPLPPLPPSSMIRPPSPVRPPYPGIQPSRNPRLGANPEITPGPSQSRGGLSSGAVRAPCRLIYHVTWFDLLYTGQGETLTLTSAP